MAGVVSEEAAVSLSGLGSAFPLGMVVDETSGAVVFASGVSRGLDAGDGAVRETEVFVERGEPGTGVSGAVEQAEVVSVADDDNASACSDSGDAVSFGSSGEGKGARSITVSGTNATAFGLSFGEAAGVGILSARWIIWSGGFARGEMMIPGASEGRPLRDHITQPESSMVG